MKVLMISTDKTLFGQNGLGDATGRHREYAARVDRLDILVLTKNKSSINQIADNCLAKPLYFWLMKKTARKYFLEQRYDLIVCQDPFITAKIGIYLKKQFQTKLIIHFHGDFLDNNYWLKESWRHRFYKKMAEKNIYQADAIRVVSEGIRNKLLKRGIKPENIYKISTPVNLNLFESSAGDSLPIKKIILTVARIVKSKDFPTLIKAAELVYSAVPDFEWRIIGAGPLLKQLKRQTKKQSYLKWLGPIDHRHLSEHYKQAQLIALTSNNESFGKVFLEAAMAKKPAVATNTVGAQEIIDDGISGYLVSIGDYDSIAKRIIYLLTNSILTNQMGENAYRIIKEKFGWEKNINLIIKMWHETAGL